MRFLCLLLVIPLFGQNNLPPALATSGTPTFTEGQRVPLSVDLSGNLRTSGGGGGGGGNVNLTGINGTAPGVGNPLRVDPTGTTTQPVSGTFWQSVQPVSQSGTWTIQPGNTANTTPWLFTISQGGNAATVSAGGALKVDGSASTQPVSGTVTANAGTGNFTVVNSGTFATQAAQSGTWTVQPGNTANTTPWLTSISQGGNTATVTASSALKVDGSAVTQPVSGTVTVTDGAGALNVIVDSGTTTVTQATGTNLHMVCDSGCGGAAAFSDNSAFTFGTTSINVGGFVLDDVSPNAATENSAAAPRMSANRVPYGIIRDAAGNERGVNVNASNQLSTSVDNTVTVATHAVTQSGTWTMQPGNTANTTPWLASISQGGNTASVSASNALKVDGSAVTQPVSGTVTANQGGSPWQVQSNSANIATESSLAKLTQTQGSTTSGQSGTLMQAAVTTAAPSYTTGQTSPLSLTTGGLLRVDGSGVTQPVSGSLTTVSTVTSLTQMNGQAIAMNTGTRSAGTQRVTIATDDIVPASQSGTWTVQPGNTANTTPWLASISQGGNTATVTSNSALEVEGPIAHDASGTAVNPNLSGCLSLAHGTNPTAVAVNDLSRCYSNRAGIPWVMGGHPNVVTTQYYWTTAQTNDPIVTIATGLKVVVTRASVTCSNANSVNVQVRLGFGTATLPTAPTDGNAATGLLLVHEGVAAGSGVVEGVGAGILGVGADDEDLRITTSAATGGSCSALISYYTVES